MTITRTRAAATAAVIAAVAAAAFAAVSAGAQANTEWQSPPPSLANTHWGSPDPGDATVLAYTRANDGGTVGADQEDLCC